MVSCARACPPLALLYFLRPCFVFQTRAKIESAFVLFPKYQNLSILYSCSFCDDFFFFLLHLMLSNYLVFDDRADDTFYQ